MSRTRSMFWRIWLRSLTVKRPQALLALVSLLVGAAVASALLNLYRDARRRMSEEFQSYGANVIIAPAVDAAGATGPLAVMSAGVADSLAEVERETPGLQAAPVLDAVVRLTGGSDATQSAWGIAVGADFEALRGVNPTWKLDPPSAKIGPSECLAGARLAARFHAGVGTVLEIGSTGSSPVMRAAVAGVVSSGGPEDDQVFLPLDTLQRLAGLTGRISVVELSVPGSQKLIESTVQQLKSAVAAGPERAEVRPIRQIVYSEGKLLNTIRGLLLSLTGLIVGIVVLCVTATMMVIVLDRRKDVAVMKALGASSRTVVALLITEVSTLGLLAALGGFALGGVLVHRLGQRVFGVGLSLDWRLLPWVCLVAVVVTVLSSWLPIRSVRTVDPAATLRGE